MAISRAAAVASEIELRSLNEAGRFCIDVRFRLRRDGVFSFVYDGIGYGLGEGHGWAEWGDPPGAGFRFSRLVRGLATYDGSGFPARGRPKPYDDGVLDHHINVYRFGVSKHSSSVSQI